MNALSKTSAEVVEVYVKNGDAVKKGDIIAKLDSETLEKNIEKSELAIKNQQTSNDHTLADAQRACDNFKYALDNGLNSSLNSVQTQKNNAQKALDTLLDSYNDYVDALKDAVEIGGKPDAYTMVTARDEYEKAVSEYESAKESVDALLEKQAALGEFSSTDKLSLDSFISYMNSCEAKVTSAKEAYKVAVNNYCDSFDASLKSLVDNIDTATTALDTATESYNSVKLQLDQQLASLEATLQKAKDTLSLESANKDLENLKDSLKNYVISAPCDGIVTSLNVDEGDMVGTGSVAATVSNLGELEISIKIDEYSILNTEIGKQVEIYIDSIGRTYEGTITWIANNATIAQGVSYFEATVEFNADEYVRGGMSVEVKLISSERLGVTSVSVNAINYRADNSAFVYVKDATGALTERNVSLGTSDGNFVEITAGLEAGDKIFYIPKFNIMFPMGT
jgi:RND family efflux transporter MFP subunit